MISPTNYMWRLLSRNLWGSVHKYVSIEGCPLDLTLVEAQVLASWWVVVLFRLNSVLLVDVNHLLDFVMAAHEDTGSVVDVLRDDVEHALHVAVNGKTASCIRR